AVLRIHIHVNDTRISQRLANYPKFFSGPGSAEINFFSVYELNARILLNQYPPERYAQVMGSKTVHIALFYFGRMAEHFMIEAGRICHFANGTRIRFTIFDAEAERKEKDLRQEFPNVASLVDYSFQALPVHQPGALKKIPVEILNTVTEHVICLPTDEESFTLALALRSTILAHKNCNAPILVRMQQSNGLAQILESNLGQPEVPDGLYPFGMLDQTLHYENILSERLDNLARALHEDYVDQYLKIDKNRSSALRPWALLSEPQKKTNRLLADHLPFKLRSIRCSLTYKPLSLPVLNVQETEILARVEHERWRANQTFEGWRFGTNRIERARINPLTKNWDQIPEQERRVQKSAIKRLPELLESRLQLGMERNFIIGVTGHRLHKMDPDSHHLKQRIEAVLKEITDENPGYRFLIASPLAEGADRLVARLAMELFSMPLIVPLPLPYELYQDDFTDSDSVEEFKEFVGRAEFYFELPMRFGNLETLSASDDDPDCPRNKQYALAGAYLAETSDELIAIYDNKPASGIGGTGQIVRWRSDARIPEEFANLADFIQRPVMKYPRIITLSE
ncbi:MAG: hypothetical protein OEZ23_08720, partial [Gammaproteobacteria bacterium]|nr:hypothetical protein [Gammaproteobacteria bacterium]